MEILRSDDPMFERFGQAYVTTAYPGVVKAWHRHRKQTDFIAVVAGMAKIALYDDREGSPTHGEVNEIHAGVHCPVIVRIPPGVWHGFKCISETECVVVNVPTEAYSRAEPDEQRAEPHGGAIPFDWTRRDR
jgi:dTDP-4-dehydrorhamnose 3,5-epimerase